MTNPRLIARLVQHDYGGGYNGTCYECPYASEPLQSNGYPAFWEDIANDPTEAYFRCSLPTRANEVQWGEYAPCTATEWALAHLPDLDLSMLSLWQVESPDYIVGAVMLHLLDMLPEDTDAGISGSDPLVLSNLNRPYKRNPS